VTATTPEPWVPASDGGAPPGLRAPAAALARWWEAVGRDRSWWLGAGVAVLGLSIALGVHPPTAATLYWHLANGEAIHGVVLPSHDPALVGSTHPFDARSWLADLALARAAGRLGPVGLTALGVAGTAALAGLVALAARAMAAPARLHPLALLAGVAAALTAMPATLAGQESLLLPIWTAALLGLLVVARPSSGAWRRGRGAARLAVPIVIVLWANTQSDVVIGVLTVGLAWAVSHVGGRDRGRPDRGPLPLWLPLAALLATWVNPHGPGLVATFPLSLGAQGALVGWGSPDLQTWAGRAAELTGLACFGVAALRPRRSHPVDASLLVAAAALALVLGQYLAVFAVVAGVWLAAQGSRLESGAASAAIARPRRRPLVRTAAIAPLLLGLALVVPAATRVASGRGPAAQVARQLPVAAAAWLRREQSPGPWLTTAAVGSYLASQFPAGGRLLCTGDPIPLGEAGLRRCLQLATVAPGSDALLRRLRPQLAVLPRDAALTSFLATRGWRPWARTGTFEVLRPPLG